MKKFTGRYTTNTAKALKGSERILCQVSEDGTIYICNGFLLCTMNAPEYAATVQPLTCCEPGAWTFDKDGKHEDEAHKLDLVKLFADTVRDTADAAPLARAPFTVQAKKAPAACYYNADADFAAIYDTKFIDALHPAAQLRTTSAISAALAYINDEPFAVVMPIRAEPNAARAIRAFFTEAAEDNTKTDEADKLRAELVQAQEEAAALRGDLYRAANEIEVKVYSNQKTVALFADGQKIAEQTGEHVFTFKVPLNGEVKLQAVAGECIDTASFRKVDTPNPGYKLVKTKSKSANWV